MSQVLILVLASLVFVLVGLVLVLVLACPVLVNITAFPRYDISKVFKSGENKVTGHCFLLIAVRVKNRQATSMCSILRRMVQIAEERTKLCIYIGRKVRIFLTIPGPPVFNAIPEAFPLELRKLRVWGFYRLF